MTAFFTKDSTASIPKKKELTNKELKVKALIEAVSHHNMAIQRCKLDSHLGQG